MKSCEHLIGQEKRKALLLERSSICLSISQRSHTHHMKAANMVLINCRCATNGDDLPGVWLKSVVAQKKRDRSYLSQSKLSWPTINHARLWFVSCYLSVRRSWNSTCTRWLLTRRPRKKCFQIGSITFYWEEVEHVLELYVKVQIIHSDLEIISEILM